MELIKKIKELSGSIAKGVILATAISTADISSHNLGIETNRVYAQEESAEEKKEQEKHPISGNLDLLAYYNGKSKKTVPYGELWLSLQLDKLSGELYLETMAEEREINGIYGELTIHYDLGSHIELNGLAPWGEFVLDTSSDDLFRGGLMWSGELWKDSFLMLRVGYSDNMDTLDATARIIFNQKLPCGFSIGVMANSGSIADGHVHAEIPRISYRLTDNIALTLEGTYDRKVIEKKAEHKFGIRGGLRIMF